MSEQMLHSSGLDLWQSESTRQPPVLLPVLDDVPVDAEVEPVPDVDVVPLPALVAEVPVEELWPSLGLVKQPARAKASEARARARVGMAHTPASAVPRAMAPSH
jgi:hypothetical protein